MLWLWGATCPWAHWFEFRTESGLQSLVSSTSTYALCLPCQPLTLPSILTPTPLLRAAQSPCLRAVCVRTHHTEWIFEPCLPLWATQVFTYPAPLAFPFQGRASPTHATWEGRDVIKHVHRGMLLRHQGGSRGWQNYLEGLSWGVDLPASPSACLPCMVLGLPKPCGLHCCSPAGTQAPVQLTTSCFTCVCAYTCAAPSWMTSFPLSPV